MGPTHHLTGMIIQGTAAGPSSRKATLWAHDVIDSSALHPLWRWDFPRDPLFGHGIPKGAPIQSIPFESRGH